MERIINTYIRDFKTTLQTIVIADIINNDLIQKEKGFKHLLIFLSGDTKGKTGEMVAGYGNKVYNR
jgi:hypothetical protein